MAGTRMRFLFNIHVREVLSPPPPLYFDLCLDFQHIQPPGGVFGIRDWTVCFFNFASVLNINVFCFISPLSFRRKRPVYELCRSFGLIIELLQWAYKTPAACRSHNTKQHHANTKYNITVINPTTRAACWSHTKHTHTRKKNLMNANQWKWVGCVLVCWEGGVAMMEKEGSCDMRDFSLERGLQMNQQKHLGLPPLL